MTPPRESRRNTSLGKWSDTNVPKRGWQWFGVDDLGEGETMECEMCETAEIRYAHSMTHELYGGVLAVGVICAAHMCGELDAIQSKEGELRKWAGKRDRFLKTLPWPENRWGHRVSSRWGIRFSLKRERDGWRGSIRYKGHWRQLNGTTKSSVGSAEALFDAVRARGWVTLGSR